MSNAELLSRIVVDPAILPGKPIVRRLRISADNILRSLAGGLIKEGPLEDYPDLESEDIRACLLYAVGLVEGSTLRPTAKVYRLKRG